MSVRFALSIERVGGLDRVERLIVLELTSTDSTGHRSPPADSAGSLLVHLGFIGSGTSRHGFSVPVTKNRSARSAPLRLDEKDVQVLRSDRLHRESVRVESRRDERGHLSGRQVGRRVEP
jgi:hypothetical protein